ncbi:MAG TPA: cellulose binding domain-containing protein [Actinoplanes sp.]|nr:cellulose binding domain-containing protein [Actinoplanes sp.]
MASVAIAAIFVAGVGVAVLGGHLGTNAYAGAKDPTRSWGCDQEEGLGGGDWSITSGGKDRNYYLGMPRNYDPSHAYRLVFAFHWQGGTARDVHEGLGYPEPYYGLRRLSNDNTIFVAPQGLNGRWANSDNEDLRFVDDLINEIESNLCVDTTQLFATGFSYGGSMAYALACDRAAVFRAVAVYSGGQLSGCTGGTKPIGYLGIHGVNDAVVRISEGRALRDRFVRANGCTTQDPPEPAGGSRTHTVTTYQKCGAGYPVVWAAFDGDHTSSPVDSGDTSSWTAPLVTDFFQQFKPYERTRSWGCGRELGLGEGDWPITSGGKDRYYFLGMPRNYDPDRAYRLVFAFHWLGGTAREIHEGGAGYPEPYFGLRRLSSDNTIFVAPQGLNGRWSNSGGEDLRFVDDLINEIESNVCVDTTQLFATGFSFGGSMAYALACDRATFFRAVAVYSGAQLSGCTGGTQPVGYLGIHGVNDAVVPISMGRALRDRFVRANGCTTQDPPEPAGGSRTHTVTTYRKCRVGNPVVWAAFDGDHKANPVDAGDASSWTAPLVTDFFQQFKPSVKSSSAPTPTPSDSPSPSPSQSSPSASPSSSSPNTQPSDSAPSSPSPSADPAGPCVAAYRLVGSWTGGFQGEVTVTNKAATRVNGWTVQMGLPAGQTLSSLWNGTNTGTTGIVAVGNLAYNGTLEPTGSTTFGFVVGGDNAAPPTSLTCTTP